MLDTGDAWVGDGLLGNKTRGEAVVAGMNLMGYDAMALGPKELELGADLLRLRMEESKFALLSANAVFHSGELVGQPYVILQVGDRRVGLIGLTRTPDQKLADFDVRDPQVALVDYARELADQVETIILLTNLPYQAASDVAKNVPGIDLVVAALPQQLPEQAVRLPQTGAILVSAEMPLPRHAGRRVGRLAVTLDSDGTLGNESWESVAMGPQIADHAEMAALLDRYR